MHELNEGVVQCREEDDVFVLRLIGKINERKLDEGAKSLRSTLVSRLDKVEIIRLLVDFRQTRWDSDETHAKARQILGRHFQGFGQRRHFSAILINQYRFPVSENEAFFTEEREALNWLRSKQ